MPLGVIQALVQTTGNCAPLTSQEELMQVGVGLHHSAAAADGTFCCIICSQPPTHQDIG